MLTKKAIKYYGEEVAEIYTNHSMTIDEACELAGIKIMKTEEDYLNGDGYDIEGLEIANVEEAAKAVNEFTSLVAEVKEYGERRTAETAFYIENGYFQTWAAEHHTDPDRGLKAHSTDTRWEQYQTGTISREKAVELATKRAKKYIDKTTAAKLEQLDRVANAPDLTSVSICVDWVRSRTWGYYPRVEIITNTGTYTGEASGCGYDKESAAIADALNKCDSMLKVLYQLKENGLRAGKTRENKTATCGRSKGDICGYGAPPYFNGRVVASFFGYILKNCGYKISCHHGQLGDFYKIEKEVE